MCIKNKIVVVALCTVIMIAGVFVGGSGTAKAQTPTTTTTTATLSIKQLQQIIDMLRQQIQQLIVLIQQRIQAAKPVAVQSTPPVVGGQCTYNTVPGLCTVKSVGTDESFTVAYLFTPNNEKDFDNTNWKGKVSEFILKEHSYPANLLGLACLSKTSPLTAQAIAACGVEADAVFKCNVKFIKSGTCSPEGVQFVGQTVNTTCGNGTCETGETATSCPADCANNTCSTDADCTYSCAYQCANKTWLNTNGDHCTGAPISWYQCTCQNGICAKKTAACGNGKCETGETATSCPADCGATYKLKCSVDADCVQYCGSSCVNSEWAKTAPVLPCPLLLQKITCICQLGQCTAKTVSPICGNGTCETGETATSCSADCGATTSCSSNLTGDACTKAGGQEICSMVCSDPGGCKSGTCTCDCGTGGGTSIHPITPTAGGGTRGALPISISSLSASLSQVISQFQNILGKLKLDL